jgi:hypothetical protein
VKSAARAVGVKFAAINAAESQANLLIALSTQLAVSAGSQNAISAAQSAPDGHQIPASSGKIYREF